MPNVTFRVFTIIDFLLFSLYRVHFNVIRTLNNIEYKFNKRTNSLYCIFHSLDLVIFRQEPEHACLARPHRTCYRGTIVTVLFKKAQRIDVFKFALVRVQPVLDIGPTSLIFKKSNRVGFSPSPLDISTKDRDNA